MKYLLLLNLLFIAACNCTNHPLKNPADNEKEFNYENSCASRVASNMIAASIHNNVNGDRDRQIDRDADRIYDQISNHLNASGRATSVRRSTFHLMDEIIQNEQLKGKKGYKLNDYHCQVKYSIRNIGSKDKMKEILNDSSNIVSFILGNYRTLGNPSVSLHAINVWGYLNRDDDGQIKIRITNSDNLRRTSRDENYYTLMNGPSGDWVVKDYPTRGQSMKVVFYSIWSKQDERSKCNGIKFYSPLATFESDEFETGECYCLPKRNRVKEVQAHITYDSNKLKCYDYIWGGVKLRIKSRKDIVNYPLPSYIKLEFNYKGVDTIYKGVIKAQVPYDADLKTAYLSGVNLIGKNIKNSIMYFYLRSYNFDEEESINYKIESFIVLEDDESIYRLQVPESQVPLFPGEG